MIREVYAACTGFKDCLGDIAVKDLKPEFTEKGLLTQIVSALLGVVLPIAGFITVTVIVISGIQFITSSGNPEAAAAAKNRLLFAIIGLVIIILAFAVLQIINAVFLGTEIV